MRKLRFWVVMLGLLTLVGSVASGEEGEVVAGGKSDSEIASPTSEEIRQFLESLVERAMESDREAFFAELQRDYGDEHPLLPVVMGQVGIRLSEQGSDAKASVVLEQALVIARRIWGEEDAKTLTVMNNLASTLKAQGNFAGARVLQDQVFSVRHRMLGEDHPDTLLSMNNLASTLNAQGDLASARDLYEQVLSVRRLTLGEDHLDTLTSMNNLAATLNAQGDLSGARDLHEQVLSIRRRALGEDHLDTLTSMSNLAVALYAQGDLADARDLLDQVFSVRRRVLGEEHPDTLISMNNLAETLHTQGDLSGAFDLHYRVLSIRRRMLREDHPDILTSMNNLAETLKALGDLSGARALQDQVLSVRHRVLGENHPKTLSSMNSLADTLHIQGDLAGALDLHRQVVSVSRRVLGNEHPSTLTSMSNLAHTFWQLNEFEAAKGLLTEVLEHRALLGHNETRLLGDLAKLHHETEDFERARFYFLQALETIEAQTLRTDVSEDVRSKFRTQFSIYYREAFANSVALEYHEEAFAITERYRTQSMTLLAEQNLFEASEIPIELREQRDKAKTHYEAVFRQFDRLRSTPRLDDETIRLVTEELDQLRRQRDVIESKIRQAVLGNEWQPPMPLTQEEIRHALDPGTLLISYVFAEEGLNLFLVSQRESLEIRHIDVDHLKLWLQVKSFRNLVNEDQPSDARDNTARWLYDKLIKPIADRVAASDRLIILPDGPLHYLPFAALRRPAEDGGQYLIEWKPIHLGASASAYAKLRQRGPPQSSDDTDTWQFVAFGDPIYPGSKDQPPEADVASHEPIEATPRAVRSAVDRGIFDGLKPLPYTLRELKKIREFFPEDAVRIHLGVDAREERVKAEATKARILHFATHGVVDPEAPLDSFLALTIPALDESAEDNGILQAWEILQRPLGADLVVLSACETAIGDDRGGEGLRSLSQFFQIAGARTVVASLWNVNDASTSELMIRFYRHLRDGKAKNEALQAAQLELIRGPIETVDTEGDPITRDFSAPYHWAAFQMIGDWQ